MKHNERFWAGQIIAWIKEAIKNGQTTFQQATNDDGIKLASGKTKFPDILLFSDKISGIIFNGWELKFPDTQADDYEMLKNALEKAEFIKSDSFVTWNGPNAIIWKIPINNYSIDSIYPLKVYPKIPSINSRDDLADPQKYNKNEKYLRERLLEILHDLDHLKLKGELSLALNISDNFIYAVKEAADIIVPQFKEEIKLLKNSNKEFRDDFNKWKIYESSTIKILSTSSRRIENINEEEILAKFTFYNLIGRIIFYLTLSENLLGKLRKPSVHNEYNIKSTLESFFNDASKIDYQAVFKPYFTDIIPFNKFTSHAILGLFDSITKFDFKILPQEVIGTILENLVPPEEKQKFGQYFTHPALANLVAFPTVHKNSSLTLDPTSGTGTFLNSFYEILKYFGNTNHVKLLDQIWGNDISHFPAILSVINLYKHNVSEVNNFPRVIRDDFFNLKPGYKIEFPNPVDSDNKINLEIPKFDSIASNFPFIQQEDIPNKELTEYFRQKFEIKQQAFLKDNGFFINERSDYFTYCLYHSTTFLNENGYLAAVTSNAWLGKEYGIQFKRFLLDNFHIRYIVKSNAEHWFSDSQVSTIFLVLQFKKSQEPTKFITINTKLENLFEHTNLNIQLKQIEEFYTEIDLCCDLKNSKWNKDNNFEDVYNKNDNSIRVSIVTQNDLYDSLKSKENWETYFVSNNLFKVFEKCLCNPYPKIIETFRGERTGWNEMFIIKTENMFDSKIEKKFLLPYVKGPKELQTVEFPQVFSHNLFVCNESESTLKNKYQGTYKWIKRFENAPNKNGEKTIKEANASNKPFWYSKNPKAANIVTAINPYERYFFSYSEKKFTIDQRLTGINVKKGWDIELIAAIYNSIVTFLTIEMKGTTRNLGALDLNANYFKNLKILNPELLSKESIEAIKDVFKPLKSREIKTIFEELKEKDRIIFDTTVLKAFNIDPVILDSLYTLLLEKVESRVTMKDK
ncbi:MAG: N-6 DNA methylase [Ignavibacteria bacterium]|nr:N-6 DNA methylase [Ignavibacteria bacterium]